ncbi:MAG: DUF4292 domain-containing protein [Deltaproteobacteria bacterium]|jgi:hypothetical protein|nr:DUF4292 domain-containing protein [Deltaproteobacteria bacterium]
MSLHPRLFPTLLVFLLFCACAPAGGGLESLPAEGDLKALELARSIYQRNRDLPTLALRGEVNYSRGTERWYFRFELVGRRPDAFLFTILDPMGTPAYRILADGSRIKALDYRQRIYYQGAGGERPLEAFLPLPLSSSEFLSLLAGILPEEPVSARGESGLSPEDRAGYLSYRSGDPNDPGPWFLRLTGGPGFRPEDKPVLTELSRGSRRDPEFSARYDKWGKHPREDIGELVDFPEELQAVWNGRSRILVKAVYTEIRLGFTAPESVFRLERPEGFSAREL